MIKKFYLFLGLLLNFLLLVSQPLAKRNYKVKGFIEFKDGSGYLSQPFTGGYNSTQFQPIDIDNNGIMDLVLFEKSDSKIFPFIRVKGDNFRYAPEYEPYFPVGNFYYKTADLNSDGKLDIFTLDQSSSLIIYKNVTQKKDSVIKFQNLGPMVYRNRFDTTFFNLFNPLALARTDLPEISDIDGDGDIDILAYDPAYTIYVLYKDVRVEKGWSKDTFQFQIMDVCYGYFNDFGNTITLECPPDRVEKLKPRHNGGSACLMFDNDADGDKELVLSNIGIKNMTFLKNGTKEFARKYDTMIAFDTIFPRNTVRASSFVFPAGFYVDIDGDSINDLMVAPNGFFDVKETHQLWYYKNKGKNNKPVFEFQKDNFMAEKTLDLGAKTAPAFADYDGDGDMDLFVASNGDFELSGGSADRIALYKNIGNKDTPVYQLLTADYLNLSTKKLANMIIHFGDVDGDKDVDLLVGHSNGKVQWYRNSAGKGNLFNLVLADTNLIKPPAVFGTSNSAPCVFNYNNDSLPDVLVGYYYGGVKLFINNGSIAKPKYIESPGNAWGMRANEWDTNASPPQFFSYGYAVPLVVDLDHDGKQDILLGTSYGYPRLYHPAGRSVFDSLSAETNWYWQKSKTDSIEPDLGAQLCPAAADLDGDSVCEIMFGLSRGGLVLLTSPGSKTGKVAVKMHPEKPVFSLFPNPTTDYLTIQRTNTIENWSVTIMDLMGHTIYTTKLMQGEPVISIKLPSCANGLYFAEVKNGSSVGVKKFLVYNN